MVSGWHRDEADLMIDRERKIAFLLLVSSLGDAEN